MAGYVLKIMVEDTHPPVWRRVMVPDKITFKDLHEIIQILFDWDDFHLHDFRIPSDSIVIDGEEGEYDFFHYGEADTLIDPFVREYKWIRYTYDFGDEWRHKILIEKQDESYQERCALLLKVKGDNFVEDCGGLWNQDEMERSVFDRELVEKRLKEMNFPVNPDLQEPELFKTYAKGKDDKFLKLVKMFSKDMEEELVKAWKETCKSQDSRLKKKVELWKEFSERSGTELYLEEEEKTCHELLTDLGEKEAKDYCKYLQLPQKDEGGFQECVDAIYETFRTYPEYLLYVLDKEEYEKLNRWRKFPYGVVQERLEDTGMIIKLLALGLADFSEKEGRGILRFAADLESLVGDLDVRKQRETYRKLKKFDEKVGNLLKFYCTMELEQLFELYGRIYKQKTEKEEFFRYVYWHGRFNNFVDTAYRLDGKSFVSVKHLDLQKILEKEEKYGKNLPYPEISAEEIEYLGDNLANRSDWMDILVNTLIYLMKVKPEDALEVLYELVSEIFSGGTIKELIEKLQELVKADWNMMLYAEIWGIFSNLMLELELPMLHGRSREQYAEEQNISPWSVDMVEASEERAWKRDGHMYEFPEEIQEWMYEADNFRDETAMKKLLDYKRKHQIESEEFLYLLGRSFVSVCKTEEAEKIICDLKKGSPEGKKAARELEEALKNFSEFEDEEDEIWDGLRGMEETGFWNFDTEMSQTPFVRISPKIGRNDPCPCGSGKKYKKCCGK